MCTAPGEGWWSRKKKESTFDLEANIKIREAVWATLQKGNYKVDQRKKQVYLIFRGKVQEFLFIRTYIGLETSKATDNDVHVWHWNMNSSRLHQHCSDLPENEALCNKENIQRWAAQLPYQLITPEKATGQSKTTATTLYLCSSCTG